MKSYHFFLLLIIIVFGSLPARAGIDPNGKDAPPEIVEHAKQLAAQKDYPGIEAMIAQIDAQYAGNHGPEYFSGLLGIKSTLTEARYPSKPDYMRIWLRRKLLWKILLTPYSHVEDVVVVQGMKNMMAGVGAPAPLGEFDQNQFIALRADGVALLKAYGNLLRAHIIPGYRPKPRHDPASLAPDDPVSFAAAVAEEKKMDAQLTRNEYENTEQYELRKSLGQIEFAAASLVKWDFSWPPVDDQAVNDLLDTFPPIMQSRDRILRDLSASRHIHLNEMQK